jgi:hypothetical protein
MIEYGIYDIGGYDSMYLSRQDKVLGILCAITDPAETKILDMLNVKYICVANMSDKKKKGYVLANRTAVASLYRNLNWMPRAYLVDRPVIIKDEDKILGKLKDKTFNPEWEVILEEDFPKIPITKSQTPNKFQLPITKFQTSEIISYKPNGVVIRTNIDSPKFLVLADSYYPGWKAYVDGEPAKIYRANYILRAVYLNKPGEHTVKFVYRPFSFKLGLGITLIGAALCIITLSCPRKPALPACPTPACRQGRVRRAGRQAYKKNGLPLEFTPARAGAAMTCERFVNAGFCAKLYITCERKRPSSNRRAQRDLP